MSHKSDTAKLTLRHSGRRPADRILRVVRAVAAYRLPRSLRQTARTPASQMVQDRLLLRRVSTKVGGRPHTSNGRGGASQDDYLDQVTRSEKSGFRGRPPRRSTDVSHNTSFAENNDTRVRSWPVSCTEQGTATPVTCNCDAAASASCHRARSSDVVAEDFNALHRRCDCRRTDVFVVNRRYQGVTHRHSASVGYYNLPVTACDTS